MIKRLMTAALAVTVFLALGSCGQKTTPQTKTPENKQEEKQQEEKQKEESKPSDSAKKEEKPAQKPSDKGGKKDDGKSSSSKKPMYKPLDATDPAFKDISIKNELDKSKPLTIPYPSFMQEKFGKGLTLEKYPEKIVDLSTSTLYLMDKMGIKPIAVSTTVKTTRSADTFKEAQKIQSGMNTVDTESVIKLQPDLVIMSAYHREKFGKVLEDLKIPVYYTVEGPAVNYERNKEATLTIAEGFGGPAAKEDVAKLYSAVEKKAADFKAKHKSRTSMVLFGMDSSYQASSKSFFGSIIKQLPFENLTDKFGGPDVNVAQVSMENIVKYNPEVLFLIAPPMGYQPKALQGAFMARVMKDKALWGKVKAVQDKHYIALPGNYTTSRGLEIVIDFSNLIDQLGEIFKD